MKRHCTIYNKETGEIVHYSNFTCEEEEEFVARNFFVRLSMFGIYDHDYLEVEADKNTHYVTKLDEDYLLTRRPELLVRTEGGKLSLAADGTDTIVLTGLPDPCEIVIDDPDPDIETTVTEVTGGGFVFIADDPGIYTVEVHRWPFLPFKVEFTAT